MKPSKSAAFITGLSLCFMILAVGTPATFAEDYIWKFNVPVELKDLPPSVESFYLEVRVNNSGSQQITRTKSAVMPLSGGRYSGVVELPVYELSTGNSVSNKTLKSYEVNLWLLGAGGSAVSANASDLPNNSNWARAAKGSNPVTMVKGTV